MHTFTSIILRRVWTTKNREPFLTSDLRERLWPYLSGIARENKMKALAIGGASDHVHMLRVCSIDSFVPDGTRIVYGAVPQR